MDTLKEEDDAMSAGDSHAAHASHASDDETTGADLHEEHDDQSEEAGVVVELDGDELIKRLDGVVRMHTAPLRHQIKLLTATLAQCVATMQTLTDRVEAAAATPAVDTATDAEAGAGAMPAPAPAPEHYETLYDIEQRQRRALEAANSGRKTPTSGGTKEVRKRVADMSGGMFARFLK